MNLFFSTFLFKTVTKYTNSCNNLWALFKFMTVHFSLDCGTETDTLADARLCKLHFVECIHITESADMMLPTCRILLRQVTSELKPKYQCTIAPCITRIQTSSNYCRNYVALVHLPIVSTEEANCAVIYIRKGILASQMRQPSKQGRSLCRPTQLPSTYKQLRVSVHRNMQLNDNRERQFCWMAGFGMFYKHTGIYCIK